ncbi:MAG: excinuclease ABC subunit UvrA [Chloroflexi bacterium]|nr:excinuclease ABC subunit UvrA [Chloroflexota bacterium]
MPPGFITVRGAREHNLKNIDVLIPRDKLVVITGVSGSGKSSLAFDTIFAEGQRRYVESLSAYAIQFLGQIEKPDVDYIEGLSPAISIDQKGASRNPRSTVGTATEIYDYLRLLYARIGRPHCPNCGREISKQTVQQIVDSILSFPESSKIILLAPIIRDRKGEHFAAFEDIRKAGYVRVRVDGRIYDLSEEFSLDKNKKHTIEVVVDRLIIDTNVDLRKRITDSVETTLKLGSGVITVLKDDSEEILFSEHFACIQCSISLEEMAPRTFSFNSPHGACPACTGLGIKLEIDTELVIPNKELSLAEGAIQAWARSGSMSGWYYSMIEGLASKYGFSTRVAVKKLSEKDLDIILHGNGGEPVLMKWSDEFGVSRSYYRSYEGVIPSLERRYRETESEYVRTEIELYMRTLPCPVCKGHRLKPASLAVTVNDLNITQATAMSVLHAEEWFALLKPPVITEQEALIAHQILKEINLRLEFLNEVGLEYLTLDRATGSLSGGEAQRIRLATQIGSNLTGVLYICDEPSVGMHSVDIHRLINILKRLRDIGNTVIVVEHDEAIMRASDYIIDIGPGAGERGGMVVAQGTLDEISKCPESLTGQYLSGRKKIPVPEQRRNGFKNEIVIKGARENNLKNIDVHIPLGKMVCFTGVSGSGKSSLVDDILYKKTAQYLYNAKERPGKFDSIQGLEYIDKVINVDQSPIGRTPRSNPATYTGAFTPIRELFAAVPEARVRGYTAGRFSFNVKGGRCEACKGAGYIEIEMQFLPDVTVRCDQCKGQRYNREALEVQFKGKNIAEVLDMSIDQAYVFYEHIPAIKNKLATMKDVGLGYIRLGQPATTLSGGEAQRVKLASELSRRSTGKTLYILDEPTTGLSFDDAAALLRVLHRLVDTGNTVVLIEHHMDLIKNADYVIDLGPGAGERGGSIIATGTPEEVAGIESSYTGQYLKKVLLKDR